MSSGSFRLPALESGQEAARTRRLNEAQREVLLQLIREALESGHPTSALELLDQLWTSDLSREDCWYLRGQALYELKRFEDAGDVAGQGLARVPRSVVLYYLLSNCELQLHNLAGAERAILGALALLPEHPLLLCRYAHLLAREGRLDEAERVLGHAVAAAPDHPLVEQERAALHAGSLIPHQSSGTADARLIESSIDPYGRSAMGLALLACAPATSIPPLAPASRSRWMGLARVLLGGVAVILAAVGLKFPAVAALAAAVLLPRRARSQPD
jgi:tetratricopeptide (TPR) repeat protein